MNIKTIWNKFWGLFENVDYENRTPAKSTEIVTHGNPYFAFHCQRCGCVFNVKMGDCGTRETHFERNITGTDTWMPDVMVDYYSFCPECGFKCWNDGKQKAETPRQLIGCRTPDMGV